MDVAKYFILYLLVGYLCLLFAIYNNVTGDRFEDRDIVISVFFVLLWPLFAIMFVLAWPAMVVYDHRKDRK